MSATADTAEIYVDWDETDTGEVTQPRESWTLGREDLKLFYTHNISIPPTVQEVARLLREVTNARGNNHR
jgi:hypothetical protein